METNAAKILIVDDDPAIHRMIGRIFRNKNIVFFPAYSGDDAPSLNKGEEMGRFNMGSTVILLLPPGTADWSASCAAGRPVQLGQVLGTLRQG